MTAARTALLVIGMLGTMAALSRADETEKPPVRIAYLGIHETTLKSTGEKITPAWFRLENLTAEPIHFTLHGHNPDTLIQQRTEDGWKTVYWNWCGMGKQAATLEPTGARTWYIDPAFYSGKYGQHLRLGVFIGTQKDANRDDPSDPIIVWSDPVEFPKVDNPPEVGFSGALRRAAKKEMDDDVHEDSSSVRSKRRQEIGRGR